MSIELTKNGRHRVRLFVNGQRRSFGTAATEDAAARLERAVVAKLENDGRETLAKFGRKWLEQREASGQRGARTYLGHWQTHVEGSALGAAAPELVSVALVETWLRAMQKKRACSPFQKADRPLSPKTIKCVVAVLRLVLDAARVAPNPVAQLRDLVREVTRKKGADATREPWTYLDQHELVSIMDTDAIPEPERLIISFAILTGLRQGEQNNLELADVRIGDEAPHVVVRFGAKNQPTKGGRPRRVYLLPRAAEVVQRWLEILPTWAPENHERLLFPTPSGGRMCRGKTPFVRTVWDKATKSGRKHDYFPDLLARAGITRKVRWHDLRHTCASALVAGWWGRRWTLDEVREHLGHTSHTTTARYAHLADSAIKRAAAETVEPLGRAVALPASRKIAFVHSLYPRSGRSEDSSTISALKAVERALGEGSPEAEAVVALVELASFLVGPLAARMRAALAAHEAGDPFAPAMLARIVEELLARLPEQADAACSSGGAS